MHVRVLHLNDFAGVWVLHSSLRGALPKNAAVRNRKAALSNRSIGLDAPTDGCVIPSLLRELR